MKQKNPPLNTVLRIELRDGFFADKLNVELKGFEPLTFALPARRSSQLSYSPISFKYTCNLKLMLTEFGFSLINTLVSLFSTQIYSNIKSIIKSE